MAFDLAKELGLKGKGKGKATGKAKAKGKAPKGATGQVRKVTFNKGTKKQKTIEFRVGVVGTRKKGNQYTRFVKPLLKKYIAAGMDPTKAMKKAAGEWRAKQK